MVKIQKTLMAGGTVESSRLEGAEHLVGCDPEDVWLLADQHRLCQGAFLMVCVQVRTIVPASLPMPDSEPRLSRKRSDRATETLRSGVSRDSHIASLVVARCEQIEVSLQRRRADVTGETEYGRSKRAAF
jgi:hypothetical protein